MEGSHENVSMQTEGGNEGPTLTDVMPEGFSDKPYMQGVDSFEKLFSQFDNMQSLIGKKTIEKEVGVPTSESPEEEWEKFYEKIGRPESADKYEFEEVKLPEGLDGEKRKEADQKAKEIFHKAGLTDKQAKMIKKSYDEMLGQEYETMVQKYQEQAEQDNQEFESLLDKHFGKEKEQASQRVFKMLQEHVPDEFKDKVLNLDNENLMVLTAALDNIHKKYISEDTTNHGGESVPTDSLEEMQQRARGLMRSDAFKNAMHRDHDSTRKQVKDLYSQIERAKASMQKKK